MNVRSSQPTVGNLLVDDLETKKISPYQIHMGLHRRSQAPPHRIQLLQLFRQFAFTQNNINIKKLHLRIHNTHVTTRCGHP
ncbi:hypothetical protein HanIR_Chr07g0332001 [Helianthus annuus]|nr:hypothetical protein HanIR_Chr07g0332001 [Helianthus annuus]